MENKVMINCNGAIQVRVIIEAGFINLFNYKFFICVNDQQNLLP